MSVRAVYVLKVWRKGQPNIETYSIKKAAQDRADELRKDGLDIEGPYSQVVGER